MTISSSSLSLGTGNSMGIVFLAITGLVSYISEFIPRLLLPCVIVAVVVVVAGPAPVMADAIEICVS